MIKNCQVCGKEFNAKQSKVKCCSAECWYGRNKSMTKECLYCGTEFNRKSKECPSRFKKRMFCSIQCMVKNREKQYQCGKPRPNTRKFGTKEDNPNWKGGVTPAHDKVRKSTLYKRWRDAIYKRDKYTCTDCGCVGGDLNAHHLKSFSDYPDIRFDINNGVTLCIPCHRKTFKRKGQRWTT